MGRNLGPLNIKDTYEGLVQISGSSRDIFTDGSGSVIDNINITASHAATADSAISASYAQTSTSSSYADTALSASYAVTASYALNGGGGGAGTLQDTLDLGNTATQNIILTGSYLRHSASFSGQLIDNLTDTYTGSGAVEHVVSLTQAEYNAIVSPDPNTYYIIVDAAPTMITGSVAGDTLIFTKSDGTTFPLTITSVASSSYAQNANSASYATTALSASYAISSSRAQTANFANVASAATSASYATTSTTSSYALTATSASYAISSSQAQNAGFAQVALAAQTATSASYASTATTASYALTALSASYAPAGATPTLDQVTTAGNTTSNSITVAGVNGTYLIPSTGDVTLGTISGDVNITAGGSVKNVNIDATSTITMTGSVDIKDSLKAVGLTYPTLDGLSGDVLTTDGLGNLTLQPAGGGGGDLQTTLDLGNTATQQIFLSGSLNSVRLGVQGNVEMGEDNTASGVSGSGVFGGHNNVASGESSVIVGGRNNSVTNTIGGCFGSEYSSVGGFRSVVIGGEQGTATGTNTFTLGGYNNTAQGSYGGVIGGTALTNTANASNVIGGTNNFQNNSNSSIIIAGGSNTIAGNNALGLFIIGGENNYFGCNGARNAGMFGGHILDMRNFWGGTNDVANGFAREVHGGFVFGRENRIGQGTGNNGANGLPLMLGGYGNVIGGSTLNTNAQATAYSTIINSSGSLIDNTTASTTTKGNFVIGGYNSRVDNSNYSGVISSPNSQVVSYDNSVIIGGSGISAQRDNEVSVPNLTITDYGSLNYADDTAAAAGGIPLGGVYHNAGALRIRIV